MDRTFLSQIAKITDHLYLSSFVGATEYNLLKYGINCVITVCKEVPKVDLKNIESIKLEVIDRPSESLDKYFDTLADKINEVAQNKGSCLVHCVAGISRSATIVLAYLMKHLKMSLREAHTLVKSRRPFIRPNLGFWKQLVDYEMSLFGKNTVKIIPSSIGYIPDVYENEVRSMQWARNNPSLAGTLAASTPNTRRFVNSKQQQNAGNLFLEPVIGNAIPKFTTSNLQNGLSGSENSKLNAKASSTYTTTYRSSYQQFQKP